MSIPDNIGLQLLRAKLGAVLRSGNFAHAYIICADEPASRDAFVTNLSAAMLCTAASDKPCFRCPDCRKIIAAIHPDIIATDTLPDKREILVEQIRKIVADAHVLPNEAQRKVFLIHNADTMNRSSQNALLKLLEEPPSYAAFILAGKNPAAFLDTIKSRCVEINLHLSANLAVPPEDSAETLLADCILNAYLDAQPFKIAAECMRAEKLDKDRMLRLLDALYLNAVTRLKQYARLLDGYSLISTKLLFLTELLDHFILMNNFNVGSGHIAGALAAKLEGFVK